MRVDIRSEFLPALDSLHILRKTGSLMQQIAKGRSVSGVTTLPRNVNVEVYPSAYRRWPKRRALLAPFVFVSLTAGIMSVAVCGLMLHTYTESYTQGQSAGYKSGYADGGSGTCIEVTNWARWAKTTEDQYLQSRQDSPATAKKVYAVIAASVDYACTKKHATPNPYEPPR